MMALQRICRRQLFAGTFGPSCRMMPQPTAAAFSSKTPPSPPPLRLQRPDRLTSLLPSSSNNQDRRGGGGEETMRRPHAITLFPGDFSDNSDEHDGMESVWGSDESDMDQQPSSGQKDHDEDTAWMIQELRRRQEADEAEKARWLVNARKPVRVSEIDARGRSYGRGGRKRAAARVWVQAGLGEVVINQRPLIDYFSRQTHREAVLAPLVATETAGDFDVVVTVQGGGLTGQAEAARHGLARALNAYDPDRYRPALKMLGYLERDARRVERKVVGRVKARKSPQWVRR